MDTFGLELPRQATPEDVNAALETNGQHVMDALRQLHTGVGSMLQQNGQAVDSVVKRLYNSVNGHLRKNKGNLQAVGNALAEHVDGMLSQNSAIINTAASHPPIADYLRSVPQAASYLPQTPVAPPPPAPAAPPVYHPELTGGCQADGTWGPVHVWEDPAGSYYITPIPYNGPHPAWQLARQEPSYAAAVQSVQGRNWLALSVPSCGTGYRPPAPPTPELGVTDYTVLINCQQREVVAVVGTPDEWKIRNWYAPVGWYPAGPITGNPQQVAQHLEAAGPSLLSTYCRPGM